MVNTSVMGPTPFYRTSMELEHPFSSILFRTSNKLEHVHLLMIELEHLNFGFERTNIEHRTQKAFTNFTKLFIEQTRTSFFRTLNGLERVHLLLIKREHPIFGFEPSNIERRT